MKIKVLIDILEELFPSHLQEDYDNSGAQVLFPDADIDTVMLALDCNIRVIEEALSNKCGLIITHHPLLFKPVRQIIASEQISESVIRLIENRISLYAVHTNLDKLYADKLAEVLGFTSARPLFPDKDNSATIGFGFIAQTGNDLSLKSLLHLVKERLGADFLLYCGETDQKVSSVAVLNGAGGSSVESIIKDNNIDCIITGDVGYHSARIAEDNSVALIDAGHYWTEKILVEFLHNDITNYLTKNNRHNEIALLISALDLNPFRVFYRK